MRFQIFGVLGFWGCLAHPPTHPPTHTCARVPGPAPIVTRLPLDRFMVTNFGRTYMYCNKYAAVDEVRSVARFFITSVLYWKLLWIIEYTLHYVNMLFAEQLNPEPLDFPKVWHHHQLDGF